MQKVKKPTEEEIKAQLTRILDHEDFRRATRIKNFLSYIVEKEVSGNGHDIKGYTIGVEVFGKSEDFDPDTDASIRVEATRLRKTLKLYYYDEGADDPIIIRIPKGSYRPHFLRNIPDENETDHRDIKKKYRRRSAAIVLILLCLAAALFIYPPTRSYIHSATHANVVYKVEDLIPTVAVMPFRIIGDQEAEEFGNGFNQKIISELSRFNTLKAVQSSSIINDNYTQNPTSEALSALDVNYIIEGTLKQKVDSFDIQIRLLDTDKTTYIWTYRQEENVLPSEVEKTQNEIAGYISGQIASPYGVIQNLEQERIRYYTFEEANSYQCILDYFSYSNNKNAAHHLKVRDCMEKVVAKEPNNSNVWAYLSWIYGNELRYNHNPTGTAAQIRKKSLDAAKKAVLTDPSNNTAHQYMANAALFNFDEKTALFHIQRSLELNPHDTETMADAAWNYGQLGMWDKTIKYALNAVRVNPGHPRWYHGILFSYYFQNGDYENALLHALESYQQEVLTSKIALCVSYYGLSKQEEAQKIVEDIQKNHPEFIKNPRGAFDTWSFRKGFVDKILIAIQGAGLPIEIDSPAP